MMAAGTAHMRMREHSTVTRSDQAELRRDARRTGPAVKSLRAFPTGRAPSTSQDKYRTSAAVPVTISRRMRNWLLSDDADPSLRFRVLRELLDRPSDDPEVLAAQKQIGRKDGRRRSSSSSTPEANGTPPATPRESCTAR